MVLEWIAQLAKTNHLQEGSAEIN